MIKPSLLRNRAFTSGLVVGLAFFAGFAGLVMVTSLFFQLGLRFSPEHAGLAEIIVAKHRSGPTGLAQLSFLSHYTKFENMARDL